MKYQVEAAVRVTDENGKEVLGKTIVRDVEGESHGQAQMFAWSEAGSNIASFLGISDKEKFDLLSKQVFDRFRDVIGQVRAGIKKKDNNN